MLNHINFSVLLTPIHPTPKGVGFLGQNHGKNIIFLSLLLVLISGCATLTQEDINNLLKNPETRAVVYEVLSNSCLNITKRSEDNYYVEYEKCDEWSATNSTKGMIIYKQVETITDSTTTTSTTTSTTIKPIEINESDILVYKGEEYEID